MLTKTKPKNRKKNQKCKILRNKQKMVWRYGEKVICLMGSEKMGLRTDGRSREDGSSAV